MTVTSSSTMKSRLELTSRHPRRQSWCAACPEALADVGISPRITFHSRRFVLEMASISLARARFSAVVGSPGFQARQLVTASFPGSASVSRVELEAILELAAGSILPSDLRMIG